MDSEECPGTRRGRGKGEERQGAGAGGGAFTVAWRCPEQQLMECPGIIGGTQGRCQGQGPVSLTPA